MPYTEPNPVTGYVRQTMLSKPSLMRYVYGFGDDDFFTRAGPLLTFLLATRPTSSPLDCDILPAQKNNLTHSITVEDIGTRTCLKPTEWNAFRRTRGARRAFLDAHADRLLMDAEIALDAVLNASTNTISLATDNQMTREEFYTGLASLQKNSRDGLANAVFVTSSNALWADLMDNSLANPGGVLPQNGIAGTVAYLPFGIPVIIDAQMTNSTAAGGTAAYLWTRDGVLGAMDDLDTIIPGTKNPLTGTYDITSTIAFGFKLTEGLADPRVVRFVNP